MIKKKIKTTVKKTAAPKPKKIIKPKAQKPAVKTVKAATLKVKKPVAVKKKPVAVHIEVPVRQISPVQEAPRIIPQPKAPVITPAQPKKEFVKPAVHVKPQAVHPPVHPSVRPSAPIPAPVAPVTPAPVVLSKEIELELPINVKDLAIKLQEKSSVIIKKLLDMGVMAGINQNLPEEVVAKICAKYNCAIKKAPDQEELALQVHMETDLAEQLKPRAPVVTIMGHVDHGKTSLLDAIRKTKVAESEHGGITQHIGAYRVKLEHGEITFLDTPGHEAFTAMRARGAGVTDIVVLVVAADDGIMPQTIEAIDHARAAGVSIIVAINKIDKAGADLDRVKKQLQKHELVAEDWGGKTIMVPVSAKTGQGIDSLLEMILLEAQMLELKANPLRPARGIVIEAKMAKGRGPVATLLVQNGTLRLNESIIVGSLYGKIRAMLNDHGHAITSAGPGEPAEILGISGIPAAGEQFFAIPDDKQAKALAEGRLEKEKAQLVKPLQHISLEDLHAQITAGKIKELKIILKADVQGSLEAIKDTLAKLIVEEIKIEVIHSGVGNINSSDAILAVASNALIVGFNVVIDDLAREIIAKEGLDVKTYNIIYELANEIKAAVEGMLEPKLKKVFVGRVEVRKVFKLSRSGVVSGCFVTKGKITRGSHIALLRNGAVVFEGKLSSLKRFKDDVREVAEGFECGITLAGFDQVMEGDTIEAHDIEKIARKL